MNESNFFNNVNNIYPIPRNIKFAHLSNEFEEDDAYVLEYKNYYISSSGCFYCDTVNVHVIKTYDFNDVVKNLDFNNKRLLRCIMMLYKKVADDVQSDIRSKVRDKNTEVVKKLEIVGCLNFLRDLYYEKGFIESTEVFLRDAFTAFKLEIEFYEKFYDSSFNSKQYIEPFKALIDRVGFNTSMIEDYNKHKFFTEVPNNLNCILLCYNLFQNEFIVRTFDASYEYKYIWEYPIPRKYYDDEYYVVGFLPTSYMWNEFENGNCFFMNPIKAIIESISYLSDDLIPSRYLCDEIDSDSYDLMILSSLDLELEENDYEEEIKPNDKSKLISLNKCYNKIKTDYYIKKKIHKENSKEFMKILRDILKNNYYIIDQLNNDKLTKDERLYELLELVRPLVNFT